jgi:hypothetical protein
MSEEKKMTHIHTHEKSVVCLFLYTAQKKIKNPLFFLHHHLFVFFCFQKVKHKHALIYLRVYIYVKISFTTTEILQNRSYVYMIDFLFCYSAMT